MSKHTFVVRHRCLEATNTACSVRAAASTCWNAAITNVGASNTALKAFDCVFIVSCLQPGFAGVPPALLEGFELPPIVNCQVFGLPTPITSRCGFRFPLRFRLPARQFSYLGFVVVLHVGMAPVRKERCHATSVGASHALCLLHSRPLRHKLARNGWLQQSDTQN